MDPVAFHKSLAAENSAQTLEASLFKSSPPMVKALHKQAKQLIREHKRKEWFATRFGSVLDPKPL